MAGKSGRGRRSIMRDDLVERGQAFYDEHLKEELEPEHAGRYVAIEPDSGRYFLVDTGFTGALVLPRAFVTDNALPVVGRETFTTVEGQEIEADIALAEVEWLGEAQTRRGIVSEGEEAMIGTEMLIGTVLTIDYVAAGVTVTKP